MPDSKSSKSKTLDFNIIAIKKQRIKLKNKIDHLLPFSITLNVQKIFKCAFSKYLK